MTPDRRAKIIELARAMSDLNYHSNAADSYMTSALTSPEKLDAAAERLDKAMVAWFQDHSTTCDGNGLLQLIDENKCDKF
jgi:hypothetical protein